MPSRRRVLQMLGAGGVIGGGGWALFGGTRANAYYQGPVSDHFDGVRFFNPGRRARRDAWRFCAGSFQIAGSRGRPRSRVNSPLTGRPHRSTGDGVRVTYVGHASFLLQTRGKNILIDPVWADRASPFSFVGPRRVNAPGIAFDDLPKIDAVLVTHNHYDHMDTGTIGRLWQRFRSRIVTPLGNDTILKGAVPDIAADAVDWDAAVDLGDGLVVHAEPTQHWSARGTGDRSHALWTSFVVQAGARRSTASATAASAPAPRSRACADAIPILRWRCCRSAPTSRAGSCARPHEPRRVRAGAAAVRRRAGVRASLGDVPAHQRGRGAAGHRPDGGARQARHRAGTFSGAQARRGADGVMQWCRLGQAKRRPNAAVTKRVLGHRCRLTQPTHVQPDLLLLAPDYARQLRHVVRTPRSFVVAACHPVEKRGVRPVRRRLH